MAVNCYPKAAELGIADAQIALRRECLHQPSGIVQGF
jgi:hypothetical protein